MKLPFNSGGDDISLVLESNGSKGYLSSNKEGGRGMDDIYCFDYPGSFNRPDPVTADNNGPAAPPATPVTAARQPTAEEEADKQQLEQLHFYYDFNSARLLTESRQILETVVEVLQRNPDWKIMVLSYADCRGSDQYNTDLSALRCFSVIEYLAGKGIRPARIYYSNKGEKYPVNGCNCDNNKPCSEEEYKQNRRSELKVIW
jgi:outer membrane protein OmpA-like peptidoglycan-associated protein